MSVHDHITSHGDIYLWGYVGELTKVLPAFHFRGSVGDGDKRCHNLSLPRPPHIYISQLLPYLSQPLQNLGITCRAVCTHLRSRDPWLFTWELGTLLFCVPIQYRSH